MAEVLTLKWGTLKRWDSLRPENVKRVERYYELGASMSAMAQRDTPEQKQLICDLIDAVDGEIWNDWDGKVITKEDAKKYVTEYGQRK